MAETMPSVAPEKLRICENVVAPRMRMLKAQGLESRGLLPGDVLYIYTGWGDNWKDPDTEKFYYTKGPGLAYQGCSMLYTESGMQQWLTI